MVIRKTKEATTNILKSKKYLYTILIVNNITDNKTFTNYKQKKLLLTFLNLKSIYTLVSRLIILLTIKPFAEL